MRLCPAIWMLLAAACACGSEYARRVAGHGSLDGKTGIQVAISPTAISTDNIGLIYINSEQSGQLFRFGPLVDNIQMLLNRNGVAPASALVFPASGGWMGPTTDTARIGQAIQGVDGNFVIAADTQVLRYDNSTGLTIRIAGTGVRGFNGDNLAAIETQLNGSFWLTQDSAGNVYVTDRGNCVVRRWNRSTGLMSIVAGNAALACGGLTSSGDGGPANLAGLAGPEGLAILGNGLLIAESFSGRVRRVDLTSGIITTFAGTTTGFSGDGGPAVLARLSFPVGLASDAGSNVYIADQGNLRIRKVDAGGTIQTVAGTGGAGFSGDGGPATSATFSGLSGVSMDPFGTLYLTDNKRVRRISGGVIQTIAGNGEGNLIQSGLDASGALLSQPHSIAADPQGNLIFLAGDQVFRFVWGLYTLEWVAGSANGSTEDGVLATSARLLSPTSVQVDPGGNIWFLERGTRRVRRIVAGTGRVETVFDVSSLGLPFAITLTPANTVLVAEPSRIHYWDGVNLAPWAGSGVPGYADGAQASASFRLATEEQAISEPRGQVMALADGGTTVYVLDAGNRRVRRVAGGVVTTVAGNGSDTASGNGGAPLSAGLGDPVSLAIDRQGNLVVGTTTGYLWRVVWSGGSFARMEAYAGQNTAGFAGEEGPPLGLKFEHPSGIAFDPGNHAFVADARNNRIVMVGDDTAAPFGSFDDPREGATNLNGQVSVTGWALDDFGVASVVIKRDPVSGENPEAIGPDGLVYIGHALFVNDARPDVAATYPTNPMQRRGGWGYPMLTYGLPNNGNGTFRIWAVATDFLGRSTRIAGRQLTFNAGSRVKPFGTIDAPAVGGIASGSAYVNGGWILTPPPAVIPGNGSTIQILMDGVFLNQAARYSIPRGDVAGLFTGFANAAASGTEYVLNLRQWPDGLHNIAWVATDSAGNIDGIGSRFFTILNGATGGAADPDRAAADQVLKRPARRSQGAPCAMRGYREDAPCERLAAGPTGVLEFEAQAGERVVLSLGEPMWRASVQTVQGRMPAPPGSTLKEEEGRFYWQMGPGVWGEYLLAFEATPTRAPVLIRVRVR